ncbi:MAG: hypothetical protein R3282_06270 [Rhodothermales bacterium]|nr:hypothetical protein [Rhodothermales bacterium]
MQIEDSAPVGPLIVVRPKTSFWIERNSLEFQSTTSALEDDVYDGAFCFDGSGSRWPVIGAGTTQEPSVLDRLLPWRRVTVSITFGDRQTATLGELRENLIDVLDSGNEFVDHLDADVDELRRQLAEADTFEEILQAVAGMDPAGYE